ncbi:MAG: hypothetical protein GY786_03550 [Proteobacteria bacterium]|nr:hypothetical protein [Pseudomonadota bacterium]
MPNVMLSIDAELLEKGGEYARLHRTSLNALIRKILSREIQGDQDSWIDELIHESEKSTGNSSGKMDP